MEVVVRLQEKALQGCLTNVKVLRVHLKYERVIVDSATPDIDSTVLLLLALIRMQDPTTLSQALLTLLVKREYEKICSHHLPKNKFIIKPKI